MARVLPFFPLSHGGPGVDDRRVVSGIVHVIRSRLQWKDAPAGHAPNKTLYDGSFAGAGRASSTASSRSWQVKDQSRYASLIEATHLKAHRTAASLRKKGLFPVVSGAPKTGYDSTWFRAGQRTAEYRTLHSVKP